MATPLRVGLAIVAGAMGAVGFLPLFGGPGYEHALASGLVVPATAAVVVALERARSDDPSLLAGAWRGVLVGAAFAGVSLATALLHGARVGVCDMLGGVGSYALTSGAGAVQGGLWGAVAGELARSAKRVRLAAVLLGLAAPLLSIALGVWRFWSSPMVFAFDPFVGFFSGSLYDTVIDPGAALLTYRAASLATFSGTLLALSVGRRAQGGVRFDFGTRAARARAAAAIALLAASLASVVWGWKLDHWQTSETIARALGGRRSGARCDVVYPDSVRDDVAALAVKDCDEQLAEVERVLGARGPERVTAFFFRDPAEKRRLMGAADVYIAKPWRREVYLQMAPYPHPVLGHELAHVVAGSFARGPFRVAAGANGWRPNPGLIEGLAVAASPDDDELTVVQSARAMMERRMLPPMREIFSLRFFGGNAGKSYTIAGAFVRWVLDTRGAATLRAWYGGSPLDVELGADWDTLDRKFREWLAGQPTPPAAAAYVAAKFDRPAVFGRRCPHVVDALRREADGCRDGHRIARARELYQDVLSRDPGDLASRWSLASLELRTGDAAKGRAALEAIASDEKAERVWRDRATESLADWAMIEGRWDEAHVLYMDLASRAIDEDVARTLEVKALGAGEPAAREAVMALLIGARDEPPDVLFAAAQLGVSSASGSVLSSYLLGKNLVRNGRYADGAAFLDRAQDRVLAGAPWPTARVGRELLRQRGVAACALGDAGAVVRVRTQLDRPDSPFEGSAGGRESGLRRLILRCRVAK